MVDGEKAVGLVATDLVDWTPVHVFERTGTPHVAWCDLSTASFTEPFFDETVQRAMVRPFNRAFRPVTPLAMVEELQGLYPGPAPALFIFHLSRCGSTLISRMMATLPRTRVLSEPQPIESVLRLNLFHPELTDDARLQALRAIILTLGGSRRDVDRSIVKFDPWHMLDLALIRRAFPDVPCIVVYRHPLEIFASHARSVSGRMMGGPVEMRLAGLSIQHLSEMSPQSFWVHVLGLWTRVAVDAAATGARLVEYEQLPELVPRLARDFLTPLPEGKWENAMMRVAATDAKNEMMPFHPDAETKRSEVGEPYRSKIERELVPLYDELERLRRGQEGPAGSPDVSGDPRR